MKFLGKALSAEGREGVEGGTTEGPIAPRAHLLSRKRGNVNMAKEESRVSGRKTESEGNTLGMIGSGSQMLQSEQLSGAVASGLVTSHKLLKTRAYLRWSKALS